MCYSAVLFYQKLSKVINLRDLETDLIQGLGTGDNKLFVSNDFTYKQLYDLYAENGGDLTSCYSTSCLKPAQKRRSQVELVQ
jgi:hypothetical protein